MRRLAPALAAALALAAPLGASAQQAAPASQSQAAGPATVQDPLDSKDSQSSKAVRYLESQGVKMTYIGDDGGLRGYLGESANGKMQTFYITPDGEHMVAGILFKRGGTNITGMQIGAMQQRYEEAKTKALEAASGKKPEADEAAPVAAPASPSASVPATPAAPADAAKDTQPAPVSSAPAAPQAAPQPAPTETAPQSSISPSQFRSPYSKDEFLPLAEKTAWFRVGDESAPAVYMIVDPQCPYCHRAWKNLQPLVYAKKVQLRLIMISILKGSDPIARTILGRENPGQAWLQGEGSVDGIQVANIAEAGTPEWDRGSKYLAINESFARRFELNSTPFAAYVGKDGKLYSSKGLPENPADFLGGLL